MAICRWSTDNYNSDLYIYESRYGGWVIHVATTRPAYPVTPLPKLTRDTVQEYAAALQKQHEEMEHMPRVLIGLPHDGMSLCTTDLMDLRELMLALRREGYRVPDSVFDVVEEEILERAQSFQAVAQEIQGRQEEER